MRKALFAVVALVVVLAIGASCGCGGNSEKARGFMQKGDALLKVVEGQYTEISQKTTTLVTDYSAGKNTEPTGVQASIDEITALLDKARTGGDAASAEYAKILSLKGVSDYVDYAATQIEVIGKLNEANEEVRAMLDVIKVSSTTGQPPDVQKLTALSTNLQELSSEIDKLIKEANDIKKSKDL